MAENCKIGEREAVERTDGKRKKEAKGDQGRGSCVGECKSLYAEQADGKVNTKYSKKRLDDLSFSSRAPCWTGQQDFSQDYWMEKRRDPCSVIVMGVNLGDLASSAGFS